MLNVYTVSFFGHRDFCSHRGCEKRLEKIIGELLRSKEYVEFLVGRNGEFDQFVSSTVRRMKREVCYSDSALVLVLAYPMVDLVKNQKNYENYYDEIEVCGESSVAHFKSAIRIRNREMVDRSDLIICYVERRRGGAYQAVQYAEAQRKSIINLAIDYDEIEDVR